MKTPMTGPRLCSDTNVIEERERKGKTEGKAMEGWGRKEEKGEKGNQRETEVELET